MDTIELSISPTVLIAIFIGGCVLLLFYIVKLFRLDNNNEEKTTKIDQTSQNSVDSKKKLKKKQSSQLEANRYYHRGQKFTSPWLLTSLKGHTGPILNIDYSANGKYLATCGEDPDPDPDKMSTTSSTSSSSCSTTSTTSDDKENVSNQSSPSSNCCPNIKLTRRQRKNNRKREDLSPETKKQKQHIKLYSPSILIPQLHLTESMFANLLHSCLLTDQQLFTMGYPVGNYKDCTVFFYNLSPHQRKRHELDVNARDFVPKSIYVPSRCNVGSGSNSSSSSECSEFDSGSEPELYNTPKRRDEISLGVERICARCSRGFFITETEYLTHERCIHHWGKLMFNKSPEHPKTYTCCQGRSGSTGCVTSKLHVWNGVKEGINGPFSGYVRTRPRKQGDGGGDSGGVYALDCEMCYTIAGLEVTKVTVVGMDGKLVYDSYVRPQNEIVDYNTRYSGITAKDMSRSSVKTLKQVQNDLRGFISAKTILIGHGLENDLRALKMIHKYVVDTSIVFPHAKGYPYRKSLKMLVNSVLGRDIQNNVNGHDSYEDALACMELMIWKVVREFVAIE